MNPQYWKNHAVGVAVSGNVNGAVLNDTERVLFVDVDRVVCGWRSMTLPLSANVREAAKGDLQQSSMQDFLRESLWPTVAP